MSVSNVSISHQLNLILQLFGINKFFTKYYELIVHDFQYHQFFTKIVENTSIYRSGRLISNFNTEKFEPK